MAQRSRHQKAPKVSETATFDAMNVVVIKCYADLKTNELMRDLVKWYLIGAEKMKKGAMSDRDWVEWIIAGISNARGNSFNEVHGADPMIVLAGLPPMEKFKAFLLSRYKALAQDPKFALLRHYWEVSKVDL